MTMPESITATVTPEPWVVAQASGAEMPLASCRFHCWGYRVSFGVTAAWFFEALAALARVLVAWRRALERRIRSGSTEATEALELSAAMYFSACSAE